MEKMLRYSEKKKKDEKEKVAEEEQSEEESRDSQDESENEDGLRRKVKMFNDSEFGIFEEVGLPTVFFGSNIAGEQMPCLTYLLAFKDKTAHSEAWSKFGPHPEWKRIVNLEEYANAMNDITRVFLKPLSYSQL